MSKQFNCDDCGNQLVDAIVTSCKRIFCKKCMPFYKTCVCLVRHDYVFPAHVLRSVFENSTEIELKNCIQKSVIEYMVRCKNITLALDNEMSAKINAADVEREEAIEKLQLECEEQDADDEAVGITKDKKFESCHEKLMSNSLRQIDIIKYRYKQLIHFHKSRADRIVSENDLIIFDYLNIVKEVVDVGLLRNMIRHVACELVLLQAEQCMPPLFDKIASKIVISVDAKEFEMLQNHCHDWWGNQMLRIMTFGVGVVVKSPPLFSGNVVVKFGHNEFSVHPLALSVVDDAYVFVPLVYNDI